MNSTEEKHIDLILKGKSLSDWIYAEDDTIELNHCSRSEASSKAFNKMVKDVLPLTTEEYADKVIKDREEEEKQKMINNIK